MTCEQLQDEYGAFALGVSDEPETMELRLHLGRNCPICVPGVRASMNLVTGMAWLVTPAEPPARLRKRILAIVNPSLIDSGSKSGFGWSLIWGAAAIVLLAMCGVLVWQLGHLSGIRRLENARMQQALDVMSASDSVELTFGTGKPHPPRGRVFINRNRGVLLMASNLPKLEPGKAFELWLIPKGPGAKPVASGTFQSQSDDTGLMLRAGAVDPDKLGVVAVTVEDAAGSDAPTTKPIIAAQTGD